MDRNELKMSYANENLPIQNTTQERKVQSPINKLAMSRMKFNPIRKFGIHQRYNTHKMSSRNMTSFRTPTPKRIMLLERFKNSKPSIENVAEFRTKISLKREYKAFSKRKKPITNM